MKLNDITPCCKICFKDIYIESLHTFLFPSQLICKSCIKEMNPIFKEFKLLNIKGLSIYRYNETLKKLIFLYKGNKDYELKDVFLFNYINVLKLRYKNYEIVYVPSSKEKIIEKGFDHVREMFKHLNLKEGVKIVKTRNEKQSDKTYKERLKIKNLFKIEEYKNIEGKKVLIVDDICTTGSTLKAIINLLIPLKPKLIEILVIAKRDFSKEEKSRIHNKIEIVE